MTDEPRSRRSDVRSFGGALALAAVVLFAVAGVLAIVAGADAMGNDGDGKDRGDDGFGGDASGVVVLLLGVLLLVCAWMSWGGRSMTAAVLGVIGGIILLVLFPDTAGILALLGGICLLVAGAAPTRRWA